MEKVTLTKEQLFRAMMLKEQKSDESNPKSDENKPKSSGEPKLYKLSDKVVKLLTERIKDEYVAHYFYRAATNWCNDMNYKKAASFFEKEASSELEHAENLQKYLTDFNIIPNIPPVKPSHTFTSLIDIINGAYEMELGLMKAYNENSHEVFSDDITTFDVLTKFRKIQKEAVIEYNDLINGYNLIDKTDKFQILYFEQTYF
jgi:ferritin